VGWVAFVIAFWAWHIPALYDRSLRSDSWHHVQHACFFATGLLFWWPVILPWPDGSSWPRWAMIPYLVLAELQNSILAAILTFSDRVIYRAYEAVHRLWDISALTDQSSGASGSTLRRHRRVEGIGRKSYRAHLHPSGTIAARMQRRT
jgi:cytochrome c oxidase assembly factor CtaG